MNRRYLIASPLVIIGIGHVASRVAFGALGPWGWVPAVLVYWGLLGAAIALGREPGAVRRWTGRARGGRGWTLLALLAGLIPMPILLQNLHLLADPVILVCWLLFDLINPSVTSPPGDEVARLHPDPRRRRCLLVDGVCA